MPTKKKSGVGLRKTIERVFDRPKTTRVHRMCVFRLCYFRIDGNVVISMQP